MCVCVCVCSYTYKLYTWFSEEKSVIISFVFVFNSILSITEKLIYNTYIYTYIEVGDEMSIADDNDVQVFPSLIT